jgi:antitoxin ParD1/3/4
MATKQINIDLTPHFDSLLKSKVSSGRYESPSEVVREGLRLLEERDELQANLDKIQREIEVGWRQSLNGEVVDGPAVFAEIRRLSKARRSKTKSRR